MTDPREEYGRRIARWSTVAGRGERQHRLISNLRLLVFVVAGVVAWLSFSLSLLSPAWLLLCLVGFVGLVATHARVLNAVERAKQARRLYERGLDRLDGRWMGQGPEGTPFLQGHDYGLDLDLFGPASLFQLLDTARTEAGQEVLAQWLREPADIGEIEARQEAVDELRHRVDFREDLAVLAAEAHVGRTTALSAWCGAAPAGLSAHVGFILGILASGSGALLVLGLSGRVGIQWVVVWLAVQAALALRWRPQVLEVTGRIETPAHDLMLLQELLERLERERFESPRLAALHTLLVSTGAPPSTRIARLRTFISILDSAHNPYFQMTGLAYVLLIRSQSAVAIDRWHAAHGQALGRWLQAVGELEALSALATHAFEHPADPFPRLSEEGPVLDAVALSHPLIAEANAVRNDVRLGGDGPSVLVVSGSNMSGKSTLLRAVGVNVVLAQAGAPVRAARMTLSPLALGATLRVEDSLIEKRSRFYSEILRISTIVDVARGPIPLLFLLDEILHGTNSYDRRIGAEAVVRTLVDAGAIGLVTTHDLALTELVQTLGPRVENVHFEDRLENGQMVFDYRMRPGVVEHSNALALMRAVGLDV